MAQLPGSAIAGCSHQEARRNRQEASKDQAMQRQTLVRLMLLLMLLPDLSHGAITGKHGAIAGKHGAIAGKRNQIGRAHV